MRLSLSIDPLTRDRAKHRPVLAPKALDRNHRRLENRGAVPKAPLRGVRDGEGDSTAKEPASMPHCTPEILTISSAQIGPGPVAPSMCRLKMSQGSVPGERSVSDTTRTSGPEP